MKIKAYTRFDEANKVHYWREFDVVKELPNVGDIDELAPEYNGEKTTVTAIRECWIDTCQGNDEVYEYDYYVVHKKFETLNDDGDWGFDNEWDEYVAVKKDLIDND